MQDRFKSQQRCECQDSTGAVCGRVMTEKELTQDDMCHHCADNVGMK